MESINRTPKKLKKVFSKLVFETITYRIILQNILSHVSSLFPITHTVVSA